jgi:hypothetical protein
MAFTEDMTVFFDTKDFAVSGDLHQVKDGSGTDVNGNFDEESVFVDIGYSGVDSSGPSFTCATSSISKTHKNWYLNVNSTEYKIILVHPDGSGVSICQLEET